MNEIIIINEDFSKLIGVSGIDRFSKEYRIVGYEKSGDFHDLVIGGIDEDYHIYTNISLGSFVTMVENRLGFNIVLEYRKIDSIIEIRNEICKELGINRDHMSEEEFMQTVLDKIVDIKKAYVELNTDLEKAVENSVDMHIELALLHGGM